MEPVQIKFISSDKEVPEDIPITDDERWFIFIDYDGEPHIGFHITGNQFRDSSDQHGWWEAMAWVEWKECSER